MTFHIILKTLNIDICKLKLTSLTFYFNLCKVKANLEVSLVAQLVKNLPPMQETWVGSLDGEDPLEKEMKTHSSILAWRIPWTEEPGGLQSLGHKSQTRRSN